MKKIIFAAAAGLFLIACNNVKKYEAPVNTLATQWDSTQAIVTGFVGNLNQEVANAQNSLATMQVAPEVSAKMKPEDLTKLQELQVTATGKANALTELKSEVDAFVGTWGEKGNVLNSLKEGVTAGKMPEGVDVDASISELQALVTDAGTKVAEWTGKADAAKAALQDAVKQGTDLIAAVAATTMTAKGKK